MEGSIEYYLLVNLGMNLLALSVMTNMGAGVLKEPLTEEEVEQTAGRIAAPFSAYVKDIIEQI